MIQALCLFRVEFVPYYEKDDVLYQPDRYIFNGFIRILFVSFSSSIMEVKTMKTFVKLFKILFLGLLVILLWPFLAYITLESTWLVLIICVVFGPLIIFYKDIKIWLLNKKLKKSEEDTNKK